MDIFVSQFGGFCDGVKRAYDVVKNLSLENVKKPVFVLGSLVHNDDVVRQIEKRGIGKISQEDFEKSKKGEIGTIIITAHGVSPLVFEKIREKGIELLDTTCPKVTRAQRLTRNYIQRGEQVILVGDKEHKEVQGIWEWGEKKPFIVSSLEEAKRLKVPREKKTFIVSQTTQEKELVNEIFRQIKKKVDDVELTDTICNSTKNRQEEIKKLAKKVQAVLVVGGQYSANTRRLFEISKKINEKTFFIERAQDFSSRSIGKIKKIAIAAGASTPEWIISEVVRKLQSISR